MWWVMLIKLAIVAAIAVAVGLVGEQIVKRNNTKIQQENNQDIEAEQ